MTMFFIVQTLLAFVFLVAGAMKVFSQDRVRTRMEVLRGYAPSFISFIGIAEIAGALGLTLPLWLGVVPTAALFAAIGLAIIMVGAAVAHVMRKEYPQLAMAVVFFAGLVYFFFQAPVV